jgi:hypothetical protein
MMLRCYVTSRPEAGLDLRFFKWSGKVDVDESKDKGVMSGRRVGEPALAESHAGPEQGRHRPWSGRLGLDIKTSAKSGRSSAGGSNSNTTNIWAASSRSSGSSSSSGSSGSRPGSGIVLLSLGNPAEQIAGRGMRPKNLLSPLDKNVQHLKRQQLLRAEYEFDPSLANLTRPTVASIVQRAPVLPASRDVVERRAGVGRPIPVFKSDCAMADLGEQTHIWQIRHSALSTYLFDYSPSVGVRII